MKVMNTLNISAPVTYWTDSQVVLCWLAKSPSHWKTFVANRVSNIQEVSERDNWKYVKSSHNPADMLTRGMSGRALRDNRLWFHGPEWLNQSEESWPIQECSNSISLQEVKTKTPVTLTVVQFTDTLCSRCSSFYKLVRVVAFCKRFIWNCQHPTKRFAGAITVTEKESAILSIVSRVQHEAFSSEMQQLSKSRCLPNRSRILSLNPFVDTEGILRVGGRLQQSSLHENQKLPILLPQKHRVTRLIIKEEHLRNLHAGPQALQYIIRQKYWIINARKEINSVLRNCLTCFKVRPKPISQIMGDIPAARLEPKRPFSIVGLDYAGPLEIKQSTRRNAALVKGYVCLIICFITKAVHLELVSDLTTAACIAALRRFIGRRGIPNHMYSDNAKTFVAASKQLKELYTLHRSSQFKHELDRFAYNHGIQWHFIVPYSPHQGGLWESHVKLMKYHIRRVVGNSTLTFEQLCTVMTQIEACINWRPLTVMSSSPDDLQPLTPGQPLTALPSPTLVNIPHNRLHVYQHIQKLVEQF